MHKLLAIKKANTKQTTVPIKRVIIFKPPNATPIIPPISITPINIIVYIVDKSIFILLNLQTHLTNKMMIYFPYFLYI